MNLAQVIPTTGVEEDSESLFSPRYSFQIPATWKLESD